jgi:ElaB/YqjD/DUF883 family membrane-anchored ribosome-binding protein
MRRRKIMTTTSTRSRHNGHNTHDLYRDVEKIKAALLLTTQDAKDKALDLLSDSVEAMKEKSNAVKGNVETYTAKKPFKSLGAAFAAGIVIGFLFHRK